VSPPNECTLLCQQAAAHQDKLHVRGRRLRAENLKYPQSYLQRKHNLLSLADKLNKTAVHAILVISQIIRKNSKPFREREVAKKCLQMAAQTLYPEKTAVFQTHQFTNTVDNY
jgi:hypothetical protein